MQQPPGGPVSSAQSVTLVLVGSCEGTLTLLPQPLQPLHGNNELTSCCACLLNVCVHVTVWICFSILGQTVPGAGFGGGYGAAGRDSRPR